MHAYICACASTRCGKKTLRVSGCGCGCLPLMGGRDIHALVNIRAPLNASQFDRVRGKHKVVPATLALPQCQRWPFNFLGVASPKHERMYVT
jgi:hypothetical protein